MRNRISALVSAIVLSLPMTASAQLKATPYVTGLSAPIAFVQDPADPANQYVVQQGGRIRLVRNGVLQATDFLTITAADGFVSGGEQGLLGLAFAPDYATSGRFFVNFTNASGHTVVARFNRSTTNPLRADPSTRLDLLWSTGDRFIFQPFSNHNGGNLAFGPDGYLYIGMGDGGSGNDPQNNAQKPDSLLGKMLRIDVSVPNTNAKGFAIPPTNPFAGSSRPEIWDFGMRNPWRWSFDDPAHGGTGALVIGDVGQNNREEIDYEPAGHGGRNYGWRIREGTIATPGVDPTTPAFLPLTEPIFDYGRSSGASTTGGFVYRGTALPGFFGRYFFGDFVSGRIWSLALTVNPTTGEATASDLRDHTPELSSASVSTFGVDANGELYFANYSGVIYRIDSTGPAMHLDKSSLAFGAVSSNGAFTSQTASQTLRLSQAGAGVVTWTVASSAPSWLVVTPASGTGPAALNVSVRAAAGLSATQTANLTFTFTGGGPTPQTVPVTLRVASGSSQPPGGAFDTPIDGTAGLAGSIAVTGWALDDVQVTRVRIWRDPVGAETPGTLVFIGDASLVDGARPDVQAIFPSSPLSSRAGWGYLLLTNFLPNLGNGTFRLWAIAEDTDGHAVTLGSKTITCDNAGSAAPFGAIDTPDQGGVVSGVVTNFGWVLSPAPRRADPPAGGHVDLLIDGAIASAVPTGWTSRSDLTALFPAGQFPGIVSAVGNAMFDSTALANGVHTIAWVVTDNLGTASGVGSRYFTVANGTSLILTGAVPAPDVSIAPGVSAMSSAQRAVFADLPIVGRRGFDPYGGYEAFERDESGRITIRIPELGRVELWLGAGATGHAVTPGGPAALPIGSQLDPETGRFTWNPGAGFVGEYDFVLGGRTVRIVVGR